MKQGQPFTIAPDLHSPDIYSDSANLVSYKSNYRKTLPSKIEQIEALIESSGNRLDNLKRLYVKFYHMAGTSGTFGAEAVSMEAGKLVNLLQPVVDNNQILSPKLLIDLEKGVQALREAAIEASTQTIEQQAPDQEMKFRPRAADTPNNPSEIFLVDGDPEFSTYIQLFLEKLGHRVYTFPTPGDLLTISQGVRPKAIIIDLVFQDGEVEGARIIREVQKHQKPPVPVLFTSIRDDVQARLLAAGAMGTHYFKKPIDEDRLLITLDRIAFSRHEATPRVLLINSHLARGARQLEEFREAEMEVFLVKDPLQVFNALDHYRPDQLIIETDQLNSFQLAKAVRQHEAYFNLPVAIVTGVPYETASLLAAEVGADALIPYSTPPKHMVRIIRSHLKRKDLLTSTPEARTWSP